MPPIGYGFGTQRLVAPPANSPNNNNGGWLDRVLGRVDDGFDVYDRVRCALNPTAPGCYPAGTHSTPDIEASASNNTWLYVGLAAIILLVIALVIIALKK